MVPAIQRVWRRVRVIRVLLFGPLIIDNAGARRWPVPRHSSRIPPQSPQVAASRHLPPNLRLSPTHRVENPHRRPTEDRQVSERPLDSRGAQPGRRAAVARFRGGDAVDRSGVCSRLTRRLKVFRRYGFWEADGHLTTRADWPYVELTISV